MIELGDECPCDGRGFYRVAVVELDGNERNIRRPCICLDGDRWYAERLADDMLDAQHMTRARDARRRL